MVEALKLNALTYTYDTSILMSDTLGYFY